MKADAWHYRILGEEFGPVSKSTLQSLIVDGTIGPADEIRSDEGGPWQPANSLQTGAGTRGEAVLDLDALLSGASSPDDRERPAGDDFEARDLEAMLAPSTPVAHRKATANEWYYRSGGRKQGPLDFDTLFEHAAAGRLSRYDEIRAPGEEGWVEAQNIVGLFPDEGADLAAMLGTSAERAFASSAASPRRAPQRWYYRVLNQQLGPVDFESLFDLVMEGNLRPDDEIRPQDETEWKRADTMVGLFPDDVSEAAVADTVVTEATAITDDDTAVDDAEEAEWYVKIDGRESGPVSFGRLLRMATTGRLGRSDLIRLTKLGSWMEAESMVGLFPDVEPEPVTAAPTPPPQPPPPPSALPDRPEGDADDWAAAILSEPAPPSKPQPTDIAAQDEPVAAPRPQAPEYAPAGTGASAAAAFGAAAAAKKPSFTPSPKAKRSGPSFSMPSGLGDLLSDRKVLGGGAVLLAVGLFFIPWGGLFAPSSADLIQELDQIWTQTKALYEKQAPESEWAALATQVDPKLKAIAATAHDRGASPANPGVLIAFLLAGEHIPKVFAEKDKTERERIKLIETLLARGKQLK